MPKCTVCNGTGWVDIVPPDDPSIHPPDWENDAYLFHWKDAVPLISASAYKNNPYQHWIDWGKPAGWIWKPEGWSSAAYLKKNPDVASNEYYGTRPLLHYWQHGQAEGRFYTDGWAPPTTSGLHLIFDNPGSKRFYMSGIRTKDGLLMGDYGLHVGGPKIQFFDGTLHDIQIFPEMESIYNFYKNKSGQVFFTTEHYASIYKYPQMTKVYSDPSITALMFQIQEGAGGLVAQKVDTAGGSVTTIVRSLDDGETWHDWKVVSGKRMVNMGTDGVNVRLCGANFYGDTCTPMVLDENGTILIQRPDFPDTNYNAIAGRGGFWAMGANALVFNAKYSEHNAYMDWYDGKNAMCVKDFTRNYVMDIQVDQVTGYMWAIVSVWDETNWPSIELACSKDCGHSWEVVCEVPGPAIIAQYISQEDKGIYLFGGKYEDFGRVYFYKF